MLHPTLKEMIAVTKEAKNPPISHHSLAEIRRGPLKMKPLAGEPKPLPKVMNHLIHTSEGNLLIRLYYPREDRPLPALIYFHPGSFVKGDLDSHDSVCRSLAEASGCLVIAVNYPKAPEHPYPHALRQGKEAVLWIKENAKEIHCDGRLAIGGENAGGNLAAVLSHTLRGQVSLSCQVLIYPQTDLTFSSNAHQTYGTGYLLERESLEWYKKQYLPKNADSKDPSISPLFAKDFTSLPPTLILTAEYDPLRDEGEDYAQKLAAAGVPTIHQRYEGMVHGFFQMGGIIEEGRLAIETVGKTLKAHFSL